VRARLRSLLKRAGVLPYIGLARDALSQRGRKRLGDNRRALAGLRRAMARQRLPQAGQGPAFLIYGVHDVVAVIATLPVILAARSLGHRVWVLLPIRNPMIRQAYRLCGADEFLYLDDYLLEAPHPRAAAIQAALVAAGDLKEVVYKNCRVG
jgi:hypothetical protein